MNGPFPTAEAIARTRPDSRQIAFAPLTDGSRPHRSLCRFLKAAGQTRQSGLSSDVFHRGVATATRNGALAPARRRSDPDGPAAAERERRGGRAVAAGSGSAGHCRRGRVCWLGRAGARHPVAATVRGRTAGGRELRSSRSRPARSAASMRTDASTENPPPCCHACIACAASLSSRPRRTKLSRSRRRTLACTAAMAWASIPAAGWKRTPPAGADANTPSSTTQ